MNVQMEREHFKNSNGRRSLYQLKMSVFWVVVPCSVVEVYRHFRGTCCIDQKGNMMVGASTSETLVNLYQAARRYNPEDSHLHSRCRENLKSDFVSVIEYWVNKLI
jgi:hypothetical protein